MQKRKGSGKKRKAGKKHSKEDDADEPMIETTTAEKTDNSQEEPLIAIPGETKIMPIQKSADSKDAASAPSEQKEFSINSGGVTYMRADAMDFLPKPIPLNYPTVSENN